VFNYIFLITKIEISFHICLFLAHSLIMNENDFSLEIESIKVVKKLTSSHIVKNLISLIVDKSFASSNATKTLMFLNSFTTLN